MTWERAGLRFEDPILGIDPSSAAIGWGLIKGDAHESGVVRFKGEKGDKLRCYRLWLKDMVRMAQPAIVAIEMPFIGQGSAAGVIYNYQGVALDALSTYVGAVDWVASSSWKSSVLGNGGITTREKQAGKIVEMVRLLGFHVEKIDEADALCIALHVRKKFFSRIR